MQCVQKRIGVDAMLAAGIVHGVIARDRAADAAHAELEEHADRLRRAAHHIINRIIESNGHPRLHPELNGNASWLRDSLSRHNLLGILLAGIPKPRGCGTASNHRDGRRRRQPRCEPGTVSGPSRQVKRRRARQRRRQSDPADEAMIQHGFGLRSVPRTDLVEVGAEVAHDALDDLGAQPVVVGQAVAP